MVHVEPRAIERKHLYVCVPPRCRSRWASTSKFRSSSRARLCSADCEAAWFTDEEAPMPPVAQRHERTPARTSDAGACRTCGSTSRCPLLPRRPGRVRVRLADGVPDPRARPGAHGRALPRPPRGDPRPCAGPDHPGSGVRERVAPYSSWLLSVVRSIIALRRSGSCSCPAR